MLETRIAGAVLIAFVIGTGTGFLFAAMLATSRSATLRSAWFEFMDWYARKGRWS